MEILYRDRDITILSKPSGLLVHRTPLSAEEDSVVDRLRDKFGEDAPSPVHRLDRPASGLLVCANSSEAARLLCDAFQSGLVHKAYLAVVRGWIEEPGEIDIPLQRYRQGKVPRGDKEEREALTRYSPREKAEIAVGNNRFPTSRYSLIEAEPVTGRYHQLRRHLARIDHPIMGDTAHGDLRHNRLLAQYAGNRRLLLHAHRISLPHPGTGKRICFHASWPVNFSRTWKKLNPCLP